MRASAGMARAKKAKSSEKKSDDDNHKEFIDPSTLAEEAAKATKIYNYFWSNIRKMVYIQGLGTMPYDDEAARSSKTEALSRNSSYIKDKLYEQKLIDPQQLSKFIWDLVIAAFIFYSVIIIPYRLSFEQNIENETLEQVDYVVTGFFVADIIITFNTAYVDEQTELLITDRFEIVSKYISFWFWIDVISTFPFDALLKDKGISSFRLLKFIRLMRLMRILKLIKLFKSSTLAAYVESININPAFVNVIKLLIQIFFIAHLIACFWFYLTTTDGMGTDALAPSDDDPHFLNNPTLRTWATESGVFNDDSHSQYVASLYWTITTMVAVGYGDIRATNTRERLYSIFTMLSGGVMFGAVIAQVTRLIESRNPQARAFKLKMNEMKAYLDEKILPLKVKTEAKEAYIYYLQKKSSFGESGIFDALPRNLLTKLIFYIYEREISKIKLFQITEKAFVRDIITSCQPFLCARGEIIYNFGDVSDSVIFVLKGLVRVCILDGLRPVTIGYVTEGGFFGDIEFLKRSTQLATYIATTSCNFISIKNTILDSAIQKHPLSGGEVCRLITKRFETFETARKSKTKRRESSHGSSPYGFGHENSYNKFRRSLSPENSYNKFRRSLSPTKGGKRITGGVRRGSVFLSSIRGAGNSGKDSGKELFHNGDEFKESMWIDGSLRSYDNMMTYINAAPMFASQNIYRVIQRDRDFEREFGVQRMIVTESTEESLLYQGIIHPKNELKSYWDILIGALIIYSVIVIPVQISFDVNPQISTSMGQFDLSVDILFFFDIILCFRTPFFDEDADAFNVIPWEIAMNYSRTWFLVDLASSFPLDTVLETFLGGIEGASAVRLIKTFRLVRLLKLARLLKLTKYLSKLEDSIGISPAMFDLCYLMVEVVFIGHLIACFWWGMGGWMQSKSDIPRWYDDPWGYYYGSLDNAGLYDQYILSLYWTFATLATVGYGDVVAYTERERILNIGIMIVGATVFGYIVANVSALMGSLDQHKNLINERVTEVSEYLHEKNVPAGLRGTIVRHFKHLFNQKSVFDEEGILSRLPSRITQEILAIQNAETLKKITIFKYIDNDSVKIYLFQMMKPQYFDADQYLLREDTEVGEILFIVSGQARLYKNKASIRKNEQIIEKENRKNRRKNSHEKINGPSYREKSKKVLSGPSETGKRKSSFSLFNTSGGGENSPPLRSPLSSSKGKVYIQKNMSTHFRGETNDTFSSNLDLDRSLDMSSEGEKIDQKLTLAHIDAMKAMVDQKITLAHVDATNTANLIDDAYDEEEEHDKALHQQHYNGNFLQFSRVTIHEMEDKGWEFLGDVTEGEFVGHVPTMTNSRSHCSVRAITPCSVYALRVSDIRRLLVEQPQIALVLQRALTKSISSLSTSSKQHFRVKRKHFLVKIKKRFVSTRDKHIRQKPQARVSLPMNLGNDYMKRVASVVGDKGFGGGISVMGSKIGIPHLGMFKNKQSHVAVDNNGMANPNQKGNDNKGQLSEADIKKRAMERWGKIRQALKDAKVAATVDSMAENMRAMKSPLAASTTGAIVEKSRASYFEKAMRARVNSSVAIEYLLSDTNVLYNSDDDEEKEDALFYNKYVKSKSRDSRRSIHSSIHAFTDTGIQGHGHTLSHCKKLAVTHRSHMSCNDLTQFSDPSLDDLWNIPHHALDEAIDEMRNEIHSQNENAKNGHSVAKMTHKISSLVDEHNVSMMLSKRHARARANSYPSIDNKRWKNEKIHDSII